MKLENLLPVGTKVTMSEKGRRAYFDSAANPHYEHGVISAYQHLDKLYDDERHFYKVKWDNGRDNTYRVYHVDLVALPKEKCVEVPESFVREAYKVACAEWKGKLVLQFPDIEFEPKVYFALGSTFKMYGTIYTLVKTGNTAEVTLIDPTRGQAWSKPIIVFNFQKITINEMNLIATGFVCIKNTYKK